MTDQTHWRASLNEQHTAWGIALLGIVIIILAATQPQWFDFPENNEPNNKAVPVVIKSTVIKPTAIKAPASNQTAEKSITTKSVTKKPSPTKPITTKPSPAQATATAAKPIHKTTRDAHPASHSPLSSIPSGFYVQLGAFEARPRAQSFISQLKKKGWHARIANRKGKLHAVWVGPKTTRTQAEKLLKRIQDKLKHKGFIIQHKP